MDVNKSRQIHDTLKNSIIKSVDVKHPETAYNLLKNQKPYKNETFLTQNQLL